MTATPDPGGARKGGAAKGASGKAPKLPAIIVDEAHVGRLTQLANSALDRLPVVADFLLDELERARVVKSGAFPADAANMGSWVSFTDRGSGQTRTVQLVYPEEADIGLGRISVLTPIGAALLGLSAGQQMRWLTRDGAPRDLVVSAVSLTDPQA